ncbi:regulatory protein RecX [Lachnospiraceae bacterium 62-35]
MTVVSIASVDKRRCKVLFEEGFALILYRGEIKKYEIEEQKELSEKSYQELVRDVLCKRARERVMNLLKTADKTEQQLRRKLEEGCYPLEAIEYAIKFVKEYGYIDDAAYAERYVELYADKKSRRRLAADLRNKGISSEVIIQALEGSEVDEEHQIRELLEKRGFGREYEEEREWEFAPKTLRDMRRKEYQKTVSFLCRRGFSWEAIHHVMREMAEEL